MLRAPFGCEHKWLPHPTYDDKSRGRTSSPKLPDVTRHFLNASIEFEGGNESNNKGKIIGITLDVICSGVLRMDLYLWA